MVPLYFLVGYLEALSRNPSNLPHHCHTEPKWAMKEPWVFRVYTANWVIIYITYHLLREPETAIDIGDAILPNYIGVSYTGAFPWLFLVLRSMARRLQDLNGSLNALANMEAIFMF